VILMLLRNYSRLRRVAIYSLNMQLLATNMQLLATNMQLLAINMQPLATTCNQERVKI